MTNGERLGKEKGNRKEIIMLPMTCKWRTCFVIIVGMMVMKKILLGISSQTYHLGLDKKKVPKI
jgi:hypothetical protein